MKYWVVYDTHCPQPVPSSRYLSQKVPRQWNFGSQISSLEECPTSPDVISGGDGPPGMAEAPSRAS